MNKSIMFGALLIGFSVIASPFIYDHVKQSQKEIEKSKWDKDLEITNITALENFADEYKEIKGPCPKRASDMVGVVIRKEPKDRYGIEFDTTGDCKFTSLEGITSESL